MMYNYVHMRYSLSVSRLHNGIIEVAKMVRITGPFLAIGAIESSLIKNISDKPFCIVLSVIGRIDLRPSETTTILLVDRWASFLGNSWAPAPRELACKLVAQVSLACAAILSVWFRSKEKWPRNDEEREFGVLVRRKMERERGLFVSFFFRAAKTENPVPCSLLRNRTETFATQAMTSSFHSILILDLWIPVENCVTSQKNGLRWPARIACSLACMQSLLSRAPRSLRAYLL